MANMRLGDAIRLNGMMKPQGTGAESIRSVEAPCALGGALQSIGRQITGEPGDNEPYEIIKEIWPWVQNSFGTDTILNRIWRLNDSSHWTRSQIADWVDSIDPTPRDTVSEQASPVNKQKPVNELVLNSCPGR